MVELLNYIPPLLCVLRVLCVKTFSDFEQILIIPDDRHFWTFSAQKIIF